MDNFSSILDNYEKNKKQTIPTFYKPVSDVPCAGPGPATHPNYTSS